MNGFTRDQKMAMLVVPMLLFGMLGTSYSTTEERGGGNALTGVPLKEVVESKNYTEFVKILHDTPYEESATPEVFDALVLMYTLHTNGAHREAGAYFQDALYGGDKTYTEHT